MIGCHWVYVLFLQYREAEEILEDKSNIVVKEDLLNLEKRFEIKLTDIKQTIADNHYKVVLDLFTNNEKNNYFINKGNV